MTLATEMHRIYQLACVLLLSSCNSESDQEKAIPDEAFHGSGPPSIEEPPASLVDSKTAPPPRVVSVDEVIAWYRRNRDGVAGQFSGERQGDELFVLWAPRQEGAGETRVSTYIRPDGFEDFFLCDDDPVQSIDYGDEVMRHFGEVRLYQDNGTIAYFVVPDVIYSHGSNLQEVATLLRQNKKR